MKHETTGCNDCPLRHTITDFESMGETHLEICIHPNNESPHLLAHSRDKTPKIKMPDYCPLRDADFVVSLKKVS